MQDGLPLALVPLVMVAMNLAYFASAYPFGKLADTVSHTRLLAVGLVVLVASDVVLAQSAHWTAVLAGVALWNLHMGMTQGLLATMVAEASPSALRATAFGCFNLMSGLAMLGLAMLIASAFAGALWDRMGASTTFYAGALFCGLTLLVLALRRDRTAA